MVRRKAEPSHLRSVGLCSSYIKALTYHQRRKYLNNFIMIIVDFWSSEMRKNRRSKKSMQFLHLHRIMDHENKKVNQQKKYIKVCTLLKQIKNHRRYWYSWKYSGSSQQLYYEKEYHFMSGEREREQVQVSRKLVIYSLILSNSQMMNIFLHLYGRSISYCELVWNWRKEWKSTGMVIWSELIKFVQKEEFWI